MKRKVVKLGPSTLVVSLPSEWTKKVAVKCGMELEVEEVNDSLIVRPPLRHSSSISISLHDEKDSKSVLTQLSHIYRVGFDKVTISFSDERTLKLVSRIVSDYLLGFEITKKSTTSCVLESITEPTNEKFIVLLRRVFFQIKEMQELVLLDFKDNSLKRAEEIADLRRALDRHVFFCRRLLSKGVDLGESVHLVWELLSVLMNIAHAYDYMYLYYKEQKKKVSAETVLLLERLEAYFDYFYKSYVERKEGYFTERKKGSIELLNALYAAFENSRNQNKVLLGYVQQIIRFIQLGMSPVRSILADEERKRGVRT